jgi:CheY-like chemotaxis protein
MLNGAVPPINVLIVEDNIINLKLLEAFMKRLKVRWQTAMNGREAVTKWRAGGFHLVLMDIQLPIMSGLEATKEIRRLERVNCIGIFGSSASSSAPEVGEEGNVEVEDDDRLPSTAMFKSPVIIVALTASSLQSDRHEALAAGCNDFLTKVRIFPHPFCQIFKEDRANNHTACQLRLARTEGHGMGLHASTNRLRRVAQMEGLLAIDHQLRARFRERSKG